MSTKHEEIEKALAEFSRPMESVDGIDGPQLRRFMTEQPQGVSRGVGLVEIVYAREGAMNTQLGGFGSGDWVQQLDALRRLRDFVDSIQATDYALGVIDDGHGARLQGGEWSNKTTVTRWAFDTTGDFAGPLTIEQVLTALQSRTGRPWTVYGWGDAPKGAGAVYVAAHNRNRVGWMHTAFDTAQVRNLPIVAQVCPWREIGAPPHPHFGPSERAELLNWMMQRELHAAALGVPFYWLIWTTEAGTHSQNAQAPRLDADGIVEMTIQSWAGVEAMRGINDLWKQSSGHGIGKPPLPRDPLLERDRVPPDRLPIDDDDGPLPVTVSKAGEEILSLEERVSWIEREITGDDGLEVQIERMNGWLSEQQVERRLNELDQRTAPVKALSEKVGCVEGDVGALKTDVDKIRGRLLDVERRVESANV